MDASQMLAMSMQMRADAMEAQRVARNYAKAAKRSLKQVETLKQDFGIKKTHVLSSFDLFNLDPDCWTNHVVVSQDLVAHANTDSVSKIFNQKLGSPQLPIGAFSCRTVTHVPEDQEDLNCPEDGADMQTILPTDVFDHLDHLDGAANRTVVPTDAIDHLEVDEPTRVPADDCDTMLEEATTVFPESEYVATEVPESESLWDNAVVEAADFEAPALKKRRT